MTELDGLHAIKDFIMSSTSEIKLAKPYSDGQQIELVCPLVVVGYVPPKNYLPNGYDVPAIVVGMDESDEEDGENLGTVKVRLTFAVFNPSIDPSENDPQPSPDMHGYIDLLYLMRTVKQKLFSSVIIGKKISLHKPIKMAPYEEQPWPYWYGWMTFQASIASVQPELDF